MLIEGGAGVGTTCGSIKGGSERKRSAEAPITSTRNEPRATIVGEMDDFDRTVVRLFRAVGMRFLYICYARGVTGSDRTSPGTLFDGIAEIGELCGDAYTHAFGRR
jgi:hypothetical protein